VALISMNSSSVVGDYIRAHKPEIAEAWARAVTADL